jgi:hypothetical protein
MAGYRGCGGAYLAGIPLQESPGAPHRSFLALLALKRASHPILMGRRVAGVFAGHFVTGSKGPKKSYYN